MHTVTASVSRELRPYQVHGIQWMVRRLQQERAVLLCDDAGLGKTRQVLHTADAIDAKRILIVCPAGARSVWQREIIRWFFPWTARLLVVDPGVTHASERSRVERADAIVVIGYDTLSTHNNTWAANLARNNWDLLVIDEAHYLKNPSQRTQALYGSKGETNGIQAVCARVILASGTITPNHAGELYQHVRTFWADMLTVSRAGGQSHRETEAEFQERFTVCKPTPWGRQIVGSRNQGVLRERLGPVVLRRRKAEVLPELEPLVTQDVALDVPPSVRAAAGTTVHEVTRLVSPLISDDDLVARLTLKTAENSLATLRRELGELKVDATAQWVAERLECGVRKLIVFGWHIRALTTLHRLLAAYDPVIITGDTSPAGRLQAETLFQTRTSVRVLVGQILACGTAITLTAASEVAIMEPSWVPAQNSQAIDRAHRLGQHDSVLASFLYVPGTLDEKIMRVFRRKAEEIALLHDQPVASHTQGATS